MNKYFLLIIGIILISNFIPSFTIGHSYHYKTLDGEFSYTVIANKGDDLTAMENQFKTFKKKNQADALYLCRTFRKPIWKFWKWRDYLFNPIWDYPYCEKIHD